MKKVYALILLVLSIHNAHANALCQEAANTIERDECMKKELAKTESKLNSKYKKVIASLTRPDVGEEKYSISKKAVIEAQRAWVSYREKDCYASHTMWLPGTALASVDMQCMIDYANIRIKKLDDFIIDF